MDGNRLRFTRAAGSGWAVSAVLHAGIVWLSLMIFFPPDVLVEPLELKVARAQLGAKLVVFDATVVEPLLGDAPRLTEVLGDMSAAPLPITISMPTQISATGGVGSHHLSAGTDVDATGGIGRASFFGTQAEGDRFIYIVDTSGSMSAGGGRRLQRAVAELLRSVDELNEGQFFFVLLFASKTRRLFNSKDSEPQMVAATKNNKVLLRRWIRAVKPTGGTYPQEALQIAIDMRPSAIFLLSDGRFSDGRARGVSAEVKPRVRDLVARSDPGHVPIHTVAFEEPRSKENLREISNMTSGQFTYVPETFRERLRERRATDWMAVADKLEKEGRQDMAQRYYEKIVKHFAGSALAREAGRRRHDYLVMNSGAE